MALTRRRLLQNSALMAAAALPSWLAEPLAAQVAEPLVRYNIDSSDPEAQKAIEFYRAGVAAMKARPAHDPTSWIFQANIHSWPGQFGATADDPEQEFRDVFSALNTTGLTAEERARREALAQKVWGTCPHSPFDPTISFLPWHRIYAYLFERILRSAAGASVAAGFGIPYWEWTGNRTLPRAFREAVNGTQSGNALYWEVRRPSVTRMDNPAAINPALVAVAGLLQIPNFDPRLEPQAPLGFNQQLEDGPHGQVHVFVGVSPRGMGFFEEAARDPIFWPHHCNIDRLWDHWRQNSAHRNPAEARVPINTPADEQSSWAEVEHTFVDETGQERALTTEQVLIAASILDVGYVYDDLRGQPATVVAVNSAVSSAEAPAAAPATLASFGPVKVNGAPVRVELETASGAAVGATTSSAGAPEAALSPAERVLVLSDLSTEGFAAGTYGVYLNLPADVSPDPQGPYFVGAVNLFSVQAAGRPMNVPAQSTRAGHATHGGAEQRFPVADLLRRQQAGGLWDGADISVTIAPLPLAEEMPQAAAAPEAGGVPALSVGSIKLIGR